MEQEKTIVSISFKPLLYEICAYLLLTSPTFHPSLHGLHNCFCSVGGSSEPDSIVFYGGEKKNIEESVENASREMVVFLFKKYKMRVDDVNLGVLDDHENTCADFKLKRKRLECVEKGETAESLEDERAVYNKDNKTTVISIDFYMLLATVIARFKVAVTSVECVQLGVQYCKACFSIATPNGITKAKWIRSGKCSSLYAAKQTLAKRSLEFLKLLYQFEVVDVNYHMLHYSSVLTMLERESYFTMKERIHGIKEDSSANPVLVEETPVTPRGVEFQIPAVSSMPKPPKKKRSSSSSRSFADVIPDALVPSPLETVFQRRSSA